MSCNGNKAQEIDDQDWMPAPLYFLQTSHKYYEEIQEGIWVNFTASAFRMLNLILFFLQILKVKLLTLFGAQADTGVFPRDSREHLKI